MVLAVLGIYQCRQYTPMVGLSLMPTTSAPSICRQFNPMSALSFHFHPNTTTSNRTTYCTETSDCLAYSQHLLFHRLTWRFHMIGGGFTWWLTYWCIFSYFHRQPKICVNITRLWMFRLADRCRTWINANNHFIYVRSRAYLRYIAVVDFHKKILQFLWSYPPRIFVHLKYTTTPTLGGK